MFFYARQILAERTVIFILITIFFASTSAMNAKTKNPKISFSDCSVSLSDLEGGTLDLCENQNGNIKFKILSGNRSNSGLMGDATPIFNNFWRNLDAVPEYSISLTPFRKVSNIWRVHYLDDDGREIHTTFDYFIWSRNFSVPGVGQNKFAVPYSPTRAIKCLKEQDDSNPFRGCITYYTALVCDSWHNRNNQPVTVVTYPTISVRSESYEASITMLDNYEVIQRKAEEILNQILNISC